MKEAETDFEPEVPATENATRKEIEAAIAALTPLDKKKLMISARYWARYCRLDGTEISPEDLYQESLIKTLEGERGWPKNRVKFLKQLIRGMESVARHHRARLKAESAAEENARALDPIPIRQGLSAPQPLPTSDAESMLAAKQDLEKLRDFFGDDEEGFKAVVCRANGFSQDEILDELNIDEKGWETVRKRIQRKLVTYIKGNEEES
jgi:DNA-directed RNA polymerase specialized sigma24 family protein